MTLEVIGAGFGRTGTLSMKVALEQLGYDRTHHMRDVYASAEQVRLWHDVAVGNEAAWEEIFRGYKACVDFPSSTYYRELLDHYPEAKVVLTTRDVDRWYESASSTIYEMRRLMPSWVLRLVPRLRRMFEVVDGTVWDRVFDGRFTDPVHAKQVFLEYIEQVEQDVPAEQLLVFQVADGWEPLCDFLGCEVPDGPFPHVNDADTFRRAVTALKLVRAAPYGLALVLGAAAWRRRRGWS